MMNNNNTPIEQQIKNWVNDKSSSFLTFREVIIKSHVHGIRVILVEDHKEISYSIGSSLKVAFSDALKCFESNKMARLKNDLKYEIELLERRELEFNKSKKEVEKLKKLIKDKLFSTFEDR